MASPYIPRRGDIVWIDFDPSTGTEQGKARPALVLSIESFNTVLGLALMAPITSKNKPMSLDVALTKTTKTQGYVLCHQIKVMDYEVRRVKFVETAPNTVVTEALKRSRLLLA